MENEKTIIIQPDSFVEDEKIDLSGFIDFLYVCLRNWKWFVISIALCLGVASFYLASTAPKYTRTASVHIKEDSRSNSIGNISEEFANLGFGTGSGSVNNEVVAFNSPELAEQVVKQLHLDISYLTKDGLRKKTLFGSSLPFVVSFPPSVDENNIVMTVNFLPSGELLIESIETDKGKREINKKVDFEKRLPVDYRYAVFHKTEAYKTPATPMIVTIVKSPLSATATRLHESIEAKQNNNKNSIIDITYSNPNIEKAETVINTLINEYNKNWVRDKNELCVLTSHFIDERIDVIEKELGGVDSDIATYKANNLISDPIQAASMYLAQVNQSDQEVLALTNQVYMCKYLRDYVANSDNNDKLIPSNLGIRSSDITSLVSAYNEMMLTKKTYSKNSSDNNPIVIDLNERLAAQRNVILQSLDNEQKSLEVQIASTRKTIDRGTSVLSNSPVQQRNLLSMDRQQKIKEALYLFLLQKREENELSQAFTAYNTRIISRPMGSKYPTSPKKSLILMAALLLAFLVPMLIFYLRELADTKVRGRIDLEQLTVPFIGEIPEHNVSHKKNHHWRLAKSRKKQEMQLVVAHGKNDAINEAFRIIRTNLNFLLRSNSNDRKQVILLTSANPSSGKTFISANLATVFSLQKETRVAVIDLDIRKASLSNFIGKQKTGVTNYLGGFEEDWHSLLVKLCDNDKIDVLPVGTMPPNPSELLQSERLAKLIDEMKQEYDIIILDTPPVGIVADVSIIKYLADITLFVVRTGIMERNMLPAIEKYYNDGSFNNLSLLLNGSVLDGHRYNRYGYGYGYGYGHSYGYVKKTT